MTTTSAITGGENVAVSPSKTVTVSDELKKKNIYSVFNAALSTAADKTKYAAKDLSIFDIDKDGKLSEEEMKAAVKQIRKSNAELSGMDVDKRLTKDRYRGAQTVTNEQEDIDAFKALNDLNKQESKKFYDWTGRNGENQETERTSQVEQNRRDAEQATRVMLNEMSDEYIDALDVVENKTVVATTENDAVIVSQTTNQTSDIAQAHKKWEISKMTEISPGEFDFGKGIYKKTADSYNEALHSFSSAYLNAVDTNKDGAIQESELKAYQLSMGTNLPNEIKSFYLNVVPDGVKKDLNVMDVNKDGSVSVDELSSYFYEADKNGTGEVNAKFSPNKSVTMLFEKTVEKLMKQKNITRAQAETEVRKIMAANYKDVSGKDLEVK